VDAIMPAVTRRFGRRTLFLAALIGAGFAIIGAGIVGGFAPAYVAWQMTDFRDLSRWIDFYRVNPQFMVLLPNGDEAWIGTFRDLTLELAVANSMLLVGSILVFCGIPVLARERFRRRAGISNEPRPALAS
jgi:hypothetical protein